ncbi:MAG: nickel-dependent lactate racemase [Candidatus Korarchaeota archaeon NZ13-K]|nr:MAG: nickel-dependent lactate racemase [Candidatus Korarchaeota archaeon NZ13-K]
MPELSLPYGNSRVHFSLPDDLQVNMIEPKDVKPLTNLENDLRISLRNLGDFLKPGRRIAIVADDITRPTPTARILPIFLDFLNEIGIRDEQLTLLVALGTHRPMTQSELELKYGDALSRIEVIQPDFRDPERQVRVGVMPSGAPIEVARELSKADLSIGIGCVTPHHVSGFSGGSKIILPGVSGERTVGEMHLMSARLRRSFLGIESNEVRDLMDLVAERSGLRGLIELVVDGAGRPTWVGCGGFREVFRQAVRESRRVYEVEAPGELDLVITTSYPADIDFWQAHKALYPADIVLRDGGTLILATPCPEGVSKTHPEVVELAGLPPEEIDRRVREGLVRDLIGAANSMVWSKVRSRIRVVIVSEGLDEREVRSMGFEWYGDLEEAIRRELRRLHGKPRVGVMRNSPELLPRPKI